MTRSRASSFRRSTASRWRGTPRSPRGIRQAYDAYDFQAVFHAINEFMTVDLSAFYLDVSKDRLYTFAAGSPSDGRRRPRMYVIADGLTRLIAPILSVTADEIWRHLPGSARGVGAPRASSPRTPTPGAMTD